MENVFYGLIGVLFGFLLSTFKDWWFQKVKKKKEVEYLSVRVSFLLERFVEGCIDIVSDDGRWDNDGIRHTVTTLPEFEPQLIEVDWKSLPLDLMYRLLDFPNDIFDAKNNIDAVVEHQASPPDYDEAFEERQFNYALLGIKAIEYASELRRLGGLPKRNTDKWNSLEYLAKKRKDIQECRQKIASNQRS